MKTITLAPDVEALLNRLVSTGEYPTTISEAANSILTIAFNKRERRRSECDLTVEKPPTEEELASEEWRQVEFGHHYQVSNLGRVRSMCGHPKFLKPSIFRSGHRKVVLSDTPKTKHMLIHRLVAKAFVPNPDGKSDVNHIDGNKANNRASNLEWLSNADNQRHSVSAGIRPLGSAHHKSKLTEKDVLAIRKTPNLSPASFRSLAEQYGVSTPTIRAVVLRNTWKHLDDA